MGASQSRDQITTTLYKWSSAEFREECALIYSTSGRYLSDRSCTSYYKVKPDEVILTIDDGLHLGNRVRVNMEFKAVKDSQGLFKVGSAKLKESEAVYNERSLGASKSKVLHLTYNDFKDHRFNQIDLRRINNKKYDVDFFTGFAKHDYITHSVTIYCDPSKGFVVNLSGPYRYTTSGQEELCGIDYITGWPPENVIKNAQVIWKELIPKEVETNKKADNNSVGVSGGTQQTIIHKHYHNTVHNEGINVGKGNGAIFVSIRDRRRIHMENKIINN